MQNDVFNLHGGELRASAMRVIANANQGGIAKATDLIKIGRDDLRCPLQSLA